RSDRRHDFKTCLESERFTFVHMQISHSRLRDGNEPEFVGLFAKVSGHQCVRHIILDVCREPLPDDGGRYVTAPETWKPSHFLIFLNQRLGLAGYFLGWNLNLDLALGVAFSFGGTHFAFRSCGTLVLNNPRYIARL